MRELEYISILHQTDQKELRMDGTIQGECVMLTCAFVRLFVCEFVYSKRAWTTNRTKTNRVMLESSFLHISLSCFLEQSLLSLSLSLTQHASARTDTHHLFRPTNSRRYLLTVAVKIRCDGVERRDSNSHSQYVWIQRNQAYRCTTRTRKRATCRTTTRRSTTRRCRAIQQTTKGQ